MRQEGVVTRWEDARGFGFITPVAGGSPVFLHASELPRGAARPEAGDIVTFRPTRDDRNRPRASQVQYAGAARRRTSMARGVPVAVIVGVAFYALLGVLTALKMLPGAVMALSALLSVAAFILYRTDKSAATRGAWRVSESTLQFVSLLGGWPGALLAQRVHRHKTRKQEFQVVFWAATVVNCVALAWLVIVQPIHF
ncbi:MAG: cold shock and DUF1294 domain-containing protein [Proteobacteria bacterium]|nr:cold shock and DUF1294 domain-containing protein [Pseudomonadota bacterium]MBU4188683.1 cold shock and DUF1294 domain-containing protein [Actinomycetota bacterium]MBU4418225.1 cold shock and DUF1294 domain-containing protein [Actinomycetota bacterium]MBU4587819.1 cold shock and DUF1294 domain-containing protein [Actinomycetota bacterium]